MKDKRGKTLIITNSLSYEPFLEHSNAGSCNMKCPLGDCTIKIVMENSLKRVVQTIDIKALCTPTHKG